ncbi:major facilitator superfamily domain-containing protein [Zychaea mexicana]|uniref:major facilitator superfamily domain-containing protein n=1 Tax=Zychaea mexicana TaxID=64656 RepID=UPI0022FEE986|nr:major facilitator superfamily domain-containing protein [Zychaea mexicana]KAI9490439.1 major facilitator superfamily domain-containing protein [Zychaea mexicana]
MVDDTKSAVEEPPTRDPFLDDIPNGGYGWVVVVACFFATFTLFGIANVWGIFSQAYSTSILEGKATTLQLMTIGSLLNVSINVFTPVSVLLVRYGVRLNYAVGSVLMCLGAIIASFSTELWHLYLTQGLLFGFGGSFLYMSVMSVIPQWFTTRRATAMGFSTSGAGLGGLAVSPMANYLIAKYGIPWAYRIIGFYTLGVCAVGAILIKDRLPRSYLKKRPIESPIQLSMFKDVNFDIWLVGSVIGLTGYLGPIFYLPKYAVSIGLSETDASNLLSVLLAMTAVTRLTLGFVADRIGRLNMFIICSALSGLFSFVIWTFATSYGVLLAFCILWGGTCGMYYPLASPITASVVGLKRLPSGLSIVFIFSAISAMGTPISAAIQQATPNNGYLGVQMFTGAVYVCGALICLYLKYRLTRSLWSKF